VDKFSGGEEAGTLAASITGGCETTFLTGIVGVTGGRLISTATAGGVKVGGVHENLVASLVIASNRIGGGPTSGR